MYTFARELVSNSCPTLIQLKTIIVTSAKRGNYFFISKSTQEKLPFRRGTLPTQHIQIPPRINAHKWSGGLFEKVLFFWAKDDIV